MKVLVIAEKESSVEQFIDAFIQKGFETKFLALSHINLVSKHKKTIIKAKGENIPRYDAVFIQARLNLAQFIEPLMDELITQNIYVNCRHESYYICSNEAYEFVTLAQGHVPSLKTISVGNVSALEQVGEKIGFPVLVKSFKGTEAQQVLTVNDSKELSLFSKSIKGEMDAFIVREFIPADVITCAVIGEKVFAVKRKFDEGFVGKVIDGKRYSITDTEKEAAIKAALVCGFDVAQVDLVDGKVFDVKPTISWKAFDKVISDSLEQHVAQLYFDKVSYFGAKKTFSDDLKEIGNIVSKTIFGGFFK
jgi:glutathione synthase/RimK-type ligase-like ATP-grasp enzyme